MIDMEHFPAQAFGDYLKTGDFGHLDAALADAEKIVSGGASVSGPGAYATLTAGAIKASQIAAGAITVAKISAGAITAGSIAGGWHSLSDLVIENPHLPLDGAGVAALLDVRDAAAIGAVPEHIWRAYDDAMPAGQATREEIKIAPNWAVLELLPDTNTGGQREDLYVSIQDEIVKQISKACAVEIDKICQKIFGTIGRVF